ncbi:hypothetical protein KFK09_001345 [Dendrobium nobile]|uniref:Uncharacterized protein n=1 Tax=Dendrobium nobile TaxID=94219 RepID=A0A8T3CAN0_DENNO|nr:hypothetical protein KFK09_001345 [Dendrobium nobile]
MAFSFSSPSITLLTLLILSSSLLLSTQTLLLPVIAGDDRTQVITYIVHVERPENTSLLFHDEWLTSYHLSFLPNATLDSGEPRLIYSYREAISGFAARLTEAEAREMRSNSGFLHAYVDRRRGLLTTHTPEFLGLSKSGGFWTSADYGRGTIIGILDTAVDISHPSFNDNGMPQPPPYWRGGCDTFPCNNKIIGVKSFSSSRRILSPADNNHTEHGTHVAGIAAGVFVDGAEVLGNGKGVSAGMAPKAHLAVYQVCSEGDCADSDVLAGIDQAIYDRVDLISISFGSDDSRPFYEDSVAIGSYSALRYRILTVAAAGNGGPVEGKVANDAPWILTVGASTTDRRITVTVKLGDGTELVGESAYQPSYFNSTEALPLTFPGFEIQGGGSKGCRNDSFDGVDISGKIVLCETGFGVENIEKGKNVRNAGGAAMIVLNQAEEGETTLSEAHVLPAAHLSYSARCSILSYYNSSANSNPTAAFVFGGTSFGALSSPAVASFSSRGPSLHNGGILKPDIIGPGVNILAAWPSKVGPDNHITTSSTEQNFNFQSGTSTATPHLSGIAALLRSVHPHWSASAIKSAIMTTADTEDAEGNTITDQLNNATAASRFAMGAGQVNPSKANNPGLVYNLHSHRYKRYLCGLGYTDRQVTTITQHHARCWRYRRELGPEQLNYPSISVALGSPSTKTVSRWVKNVGEDNATYYAKIERPEGVKVEVFPPRLYFPRRYDARRFQVVLTADRGKLAGGGAAVGQLSWVSDDHVVKSPISVTLTL